MDEPRKKVTHPWVQVAAFCDQLVEDNTGVFRLIRIIDKVTMPKPSGWNGKTHITIPITGLLGFKAGDVKGLRTVTLYHTSPTGNRKKMLEKQVEFVGGDVS